jgi:outer membrane protein insertion porin family
MLFRVKLKFARRTLVPPLALLAALFVATPAGAQTKSATTEADYQPCSTVETTQAAPPADSPALFRCAELRFHPENNPLVETETYSYYLKYKSSAAEGKWIPYKQDLVVADGNNLWKTGFLDNYWIEEIDEPYANGVKGIHVVYHLAERPRLKGVEYLGPDGKKPRVEVSKIEEAMKAKGVSLQVDSFLDQASIRRVQGVVKELYAEKGYQAADVTPKVTPVDGSSGRLVRLVFNIDEGPEIKIRQIDWQGNTAFSDGKLTGEIKDNKPHSWLSWLTQTGTYQEAKFADDAQRVSEFYQNRGYARAQVGMPQIETMEDSKDGKTRWIKLRIPVDEGQKYKLGKITVAGSTVLKDEFIIPFFKMKEGEQISRKKIIKGLEEIKKVYGHFGYWEATPSPELRFRGIDENTGKPVGPGPVPDVVDITLNMNEGKPFYVNRITFAGNTTTHDAVIRREMRVAEGMLFDSEALTDSVKRLNQLGYFKPLERPEDMDVHPTPGIPQMVDIRLKFEEQNRNQLTFGAGVSQYEGVFGQLGFQTSNFLGRGETLGVNLQKGSQARNYQLSFSKPWVFDRPISAGMDIFSRKFTFISQYSQGETGGDAVVSFPLGGYKRLSLGYSFARISISDIGPAYQGLLQDTAYDISKITPAFIYNTVNVPIFPRSGTRYTASVGVAGLGGTANFVSTNLEAIWFVPVKNKMALAVRLNSQYSRPYSGTTALPVSERAYLGGEYTVRGFDLRSIGPRDALSGVVLGGNKTLVFNAEYYFDIVRSVRFLVFFDAGQVRDLGAPFVWKDAITKFVPPPADLLQDFSGGILTFPGAPTGTTEVIGYSAATKTSVGGELRFFMPVLNVPFRLIAAYNPSRFGVLNNKLQPTQKFTFRFAVGTTF